MELLDASKENIQPLRRGRNISTLSTALHAQTDTDAHHQLMKEREEFEILVRSYSGDDPLKPWYDYVQWVEQNFPKHGREGNLKLLLENCLSQFKDSELYSQDVRYIDLWTRYINFADDPLEMYKQIHARGIGANCAIFYQCWAEEYEHAGDMKRADQIYFEGIRRHAQPIEELISAHTAFQVRVARNILGQNPIESKEQCEKERTALSSLRAHGRRRNMVDSIRVGSSIKHNTPGILRPHSNVIMADKRSGNAQLPKITVYNDENATFSDAIANSEAKTVVSLSQQSINKENVQKPGRWNEGKFRKKNLSVGLTYTSATARNPTFEVHVDENSDVPRTPKTDIVVSNVLKVRRHVYEDEKNIPVAIFETPNPSRLAMYPKNKVYSGGTEFSLEELRAILYLKPEHERKKSSVENNENGTVQVQSEIQARELQFSDRKEIVKHHDFQGHASRVNDPQLLQVYEHEVHINSERIEAHQEQEQKNSFDVFVEAEEDMEAKLKQKKPLDKVLQKEKKSVPPSAQFPGELPISGYLKVPKLIKERKESMTHETDDLHQRTLSLFEQRDSDQSLTVHTKAVLNDVKGMWVSSPPTESKRSEATTFLSRPVTSYNSKPSAPAPAAVQQTFTPFKIFSDVSALGTEQANSVMSGLKGEGKLLSVRTKSDEMIYESNLPRNRNARSLCPQSHAISNRPQTTPCSASRGKVSVGLSFSNYTENEHKPHIYERAEKDMRGTASELCGPTSQERDNSTAFYLNTDVPDAEYQATPYCTPRGKVIYSEASVNVYANPLTVSHVESNETSDSNAGIPFIPSPGMTNEQLAAMQGTDEKENACIEKNENKSCQKSSRGILASSKEVYFVPLEKQQTDTALEEQENAFSDETCCTEAFAMPLVSSTPMVHPLFKYANQDQRHYKEEVEDTIALMNLGARKQCVADEYVPISSERTSLKVSSTNHNERTVSPAELVQVAKMPSSQLSIILEVSEQKKSSTMGTTDGSCNSKSNGIVANQKYSNNSKFVSPMCYQSHLTEELAELEGDLDIFRNARGKKPILSHNNTLLRYFSGSFRDDCLRKTGFPSELHKSHCVRLNEPFNMKGNSLLSLGENMYHLVNRVSNENENQCFSALEICSKQTVQVDIKANACLWEQYIREEIRIRIADPSMIRHFVTTEKTYVFTDKHVVISCKLENGNNWSVLEDRWAEAGNNISEFDILYIASAMIDLVYHLHQCNIVHGNLSLRSFTLSDSPFFLFLQDFSSAVDVNLLPPFTLFDATEKPLYRTLNAYQVSPFQVDYIALADILHRLIFNNSLEVDEECGMYLPTLFLRNIEETLWKTVFKELLNNGEVNLLHLYNLLSQHTNRMSEDSTRRENH